MTACLVPEMGELLHAAIEMGRSNYGECGLYMLVLTELKIGGPDPLDLHNPILKLRLG
jgi:hypothetical protein